MVDFEETWQLLHANSMVKHARFVTSLRLASQVRHVPGDVVECGVWRGGMIAGIARILGNERHYQLFDSFQGLPEADLELDGSKAVRLTGTCKAPERFATRAMFLAGIDNYEIHAGWFSDTLSKVTFSDGVALLRLDSDWYASTTECLETLYPQVNPGGICIIDDWFVWRGCRRAVEDYLAKNNITDTVQHCGSDPVAYIIKGGRL